MPLPGANVFFTDQDVSTPARADGSRLITCKKETSEKALWQLEKAGRILLRVATAIE